MKHHVVVALTLLVLTMACGSQPPLETEIPTIKITSTTEPPELMRAGWWRILSGDLPGAKRLFEQSGDHRSW